LAYTLQRLTWADAPLAIIPMPVGSMALSRSLASGLCRSPADPPNIFWGVGDRGPNIKPDICADRYGAEHLRPLAALDGAKIMPLPAIGPALARFRIDGDAVVLESVVDLLTPDGQPVSGLPVPYGQHAEFEPVFDLSGAPLPTDVNGADSEGIAALPDGSFWIADEYGPSLLHVDRAGTLLRRWVPVGEGGSYAGASYPVIEALPALAAARKLNRGFEGIAVSPDGATLTLAFQSPLAHPDRAAHERSRHVRIWQLDGASGALLAEYLYPLDDPDSFLRDAALGNVGRDDIKISELQLLENGDLLVLERVTQSTKIYRVTLDPALATDPAQSDPATRPTIEQQSRRELREAGIPLLAKTLVLSTDDCPQICADLEGMILLDDRSLLLVNDSDFGIEGAETIFWRVRFDAAIAAAGPV
jgi:Esterase-like activity of phytase